MLQKWTKPVDTSGYSGPQRVGADPEEVPKDNEWYVMRSDTWHPDDPVDKRVVSMRVAASARYIRTRVSDGKWAGFDVQKVRETNEDGSITWHLLGRWF